MPNFRGSPRQVAVVLALGTGAVSTQTKLVGASPCKGKVLEVYFVGQAAVTATSLTAEVKKVVVGGGSSTSLQSAATDIKLTGSTDDIKVAAALSSDSTVRALSKDQIIEVVITADTCTAGPGDLAVVVLIEPRA